MSTPQPSFQPPEEHRMEGDLRVCDPEKTDRTKEMDSARIMGIMAEFVDGFEILKKYRLAATFFGSNRCTVGDTVYEDAALLAERLVGSGFAVVTGGAGGVMRAANQGAYRAKGDSVGLNIVLPEEQESNGFLTESKTFNYFFIRKVMLAFASEVYIFFPGGFGTMDEFFEILTLVQTKKIKKIPIILYNKTFWEPIITLMREHFLKKYQTIDPGDLELFVTVDSVEEAHKTILDLVKC